jgi:hypothetical protein
LLTSLGIITTKQVVISSQSWLLYQVRNKNSYITVSVSRECSLCTKDCFLDLYTEKNLKLKGSFSFSQMWHWQHWKRINCSWISISHGKKEPIQEECKFLWDGGRGWWWWILKSCGPSA